MPVAPVGPEVASETANLDPFIQKINDYLSRLWTVSERANGRWWSGGSAAVEHLQDLADIYVERGWDAVVVPDTRDGECICFKPKIIVQKGM